MKHLNNILTLDTIFSLYAVVVIYGITLLNTPLTYELAVLFCFLSLHLRYHQALYPFAAILWMHPNLIPISLYLGLFGILNIKNVYLTHPYPLKEIMKSQLFLLPLIGLTQNTSSFLMLSLYTQLGLWSGLFLRCFPVSGDHWLQRKYLTSRTAIAIFCLWSTFPQITTFIFLIKMLFEPLAQQSTEKKSIYFQFTLLTGFLIGFVHTLQTPLILIPFTIMLLKSLCSLLQDETNNELHLWGVM